MKYLIYFFLSCTLLCSWVEGVELHYPANATMSYTTDNRIEFSYEGVDGFVEAQMDHKYTLKDARNGSSITIKLQNFRINYRDDLRILENDIRNIKSAYQHTKNRDITFQYTKSSLKLDPKTSKKIKNYYKTDDLDSADLVPLFILAGKDLQEGQTYQFSQKENQGHYYFKEINSPSNHIDGSLWTYEILSATDEKVIISFSGEVLDIDIDGTVEGILTVNPQNVLDFELNQTTSGLAEGVVPISETIKTRPTG